MGVRDITAALRPVVDDLILVEDYLAPEEIAKAGELAKEIRAIFDTAVDRLKCGRVG
jgi:hypothetical protein